MAQLDQGHKILELGCGNGETAIQLARKFPYSIIATDINSLSITITSKRWKRVEKSALGLDASPFFCLTILCPVDKMGIWTMDLPGC